MPELLEVSMIASVAGEIEGGALTNREPFRSPHHSASMPALGGGGLRARPDEASLAITACSSSTSCPSSPVLGSKLTKTSYNRVATERNNVQPVVMYLMYVDESGDPGLFNSPTRYFTLTGMVVHELRWHETLNRLISFRQNMRRHFGLQMGEEIHAGVMLSRPGNLIRIKRNDRLTIIRLFLDELANMRFLNLINVRVDKQGKAADYDPFERAWEAMIQRFENTLKWRNFPGPWLTKDIGVIFSDAANEAALRRLYRRMRIYNPVPHMRSRFMGGYRLLPLSRIAEDPNIRYSHHSYFIQAADTAAFALYQWYAPSSYMRVKGAKNYFLRLDPVLCKVASKGPHGIVEL